MSTFLLLGLTSKRKDLTKTIDSLKAKIIHRRRGEKHLGKTYMKTNHELRLGSKRTTTTTAAVVDLAYHYTSSEEDDALYPGNIQGHALRSSKCLEVDPLSTLDRTKAAAVPGPQVKLGTPSSLKLTRRNGPGMRGGTPVRYSASMTPPPCLLRKLRQEGTVERQGREKYPRDDLLDWSSSTMEGRQSCRSSRSSLSTLTDDHVPPPQPSTALPEHRGGGEEQGLVHQSPFQHHDSQPYDTYASLKRKFQTSNTRLSSPQISNRTENGCCARRLPQSVTSSPVANGRCHHTLERTIEMLKRDSLAIGQDGRGVNQGQTTERKAPEVNEIASLRSTVEMLRDKVNRLSIPLSNAGKQISTAIKEANDLRAEALKICEYAKTAQMTLDKLTEETESLLAWLRGLISCQSQKICSCSPAAPLQIGLCCSSNTQKSPKCASPGSLGKGKEIEKSLECIVESPGYIAVPDFFAQKQVHRHRRQRSAESESSDLTSSDNETKSVVHKAQYHKS